MDQQIILACDDSGKFLEYIPKEVGHKGQGKRHLAITVLIFNSKGEVLLQKRKHQIFDNIWDLTGATHPLHKPHSCHSEERSDVGIFLNQDCHALRARNDGRCRICGTNNTDESLEEATYRCLKEEWAIGEKIPLKNFGFFNYFAPYHTVQGDLCENEHCFLMVGGYDGGIKLSPNMGYEYRWVEKQEFLQDIKLNPQHHTPWALEATKLL